MQGSSLGGGTAKIMRANGWPCFSLCIDSVSLRLKAHRSSLIANKTTSVSCICISLRCPLRQLRPCSARTHDVIGIMYRLRGTDTSLHCPTLCFSAVRNFQAEDQLHSVAQEQLIIVLWPLLGAGKETWSNEEKTRTLAVARGESR